jgi:predicted ATP-grasp superfamily ATP-dependent carboligase
MATIIVTDAHLGSATAVIRSLGRAGHRVIAAGWERPSPGFYSRHTAERVVHPSPEEDPAGAVDALLAAAAEHGADLIVPVTDDIIFPLCAARERLPAGCALPLPPDEALGLAHDKDATLRLATRLGVPAPRTVTVHDEAGARAAAADMRWPVVVKPWSSRKSEVAYAQTAEELVRRVREFKGEAGLVQEYCPGTGVGVELLAHEGRPLAAFQHRRLREVPITGGASSLRESDPLDPVLYEYSVRLMRELEWTGLAMVEFKLTPDGPKLMEINGRIWGSLPLAVRAGMDFPARMADLFLIGPPPVEARPVTDYEVGVRSRNLELDVVWVGSVLRRRRRYPFLEAPPRRAALRAALGWLSPRDGFDVLSARDPRPGFAELRRIMFKLPRKVLHGS